MPGHRLPRLKLRAGMKVSVYRGWRRPAEPERPASVCLSGKTPWRFEREVRPC